MDLSKDASAYGTEAGERKKAKKTPKAKGG